MALSVDLLHFLVGNGRVLLEQFLLVLFEVIKSALVVLGHSVLRAEHVCALAGHLDQSHFLVAAPAFVLVGLNQTSQFKFVCNDYLTAQF